MCLAKGFNSEVLNESAKCIAREQRKALLIYHHHTPWGRGSAYAINTVYSLQSRDTKMSDS